MSEQPIPFPKRKAIPPSTRFEVFKRDAFTCQYCGQKAPDVILHVDHIRPVADGGENDVMNLITACAECNGGKGSRALDDHAVIERQREQLEELNERRNQLELMVRWREELAGLKDSYIEAMQQEFLRHGPFMANETGVRDIKKWLNKYQINELIEAAATSFAQYLRLGDANEILDGSWDRAFMMIPRIVEARRRGGFSSGEMQLFYIRGILRNRFKRIPERGLIDFLQQAVDLGCDLQALQDLAKYSANWEEFHWEVAEFIDMRSSSDGEN